MKIYCQQQAASRSRWLEGAGRERDRGCPADPGAFVAPDGLPRGQKVLLGKSAQVGDGAGARGWKSGRR